MRRSLLLPLLLLLVVCGLFWLRQLRSPPVAPSLAPVGGRAAAASPVGGQPPPAVGAEALDRAAARPTSRQAATGTVILRAAWGRQPGQLGRRAASESNPEAPMAIGSGPDGELLILDQVNHRLERYRDGHRLPGIALGSDTAQDLAAGTAGRTVLLDRLVDRNLQVYGPDGALRNEVPLDGQQLPAAGLTTAVFADASGIYVEREHGMVVRVADADGNLDRPPEELAGRPTRDGQLLISAALLDPLRGEVTVRALQRASGQPAWTQTVRLGSPVLHLLLLDSDRQGRVYLAAATGHESPTPPYAIVDEAVVALQLGSGGIERSRLILPPLAAADETFRPLSIDDQGALLMMSSEPSGLVVTRYLFP